MSKSKNPCGWNRGGRRGVTMSTLSEDDETEILLRLPVKSLLKFKSVCKPWNSLISSPYFAKTHLQISASSPRILLATNPPLSVSCESLHDDDRAGHEGTPLTQLRPPVEAPDGCRPRIVGYCDGLVCLEYDDHRIVVLWNPATGESRNIPNASCSYNRPTICGLGYDPSTDDYKILRHCSVADAYGFPEYSVFDVFALKTGSWRRVHDKHDEFNYWPEAGTYANGFLHWLVVGRDPWEHKKIVSFSMSKEKFENALLALPEANEGTGFRVLAVAGECLLIYKSMAEVDTFMAWMMSDYGVRSSSSWMELCSVTLPNQTLNTYFYMRPLCSTRAGKIAFSSIGTTRLSMILRNVMTKRFMMEDKLDFVVYAESFVSPHGAKLQNQYVSRVKEPMERSDFIGDHSVFKEGETSYKKANSHLSSKRRKAS
ncbi:putative F-box protein At3g16210 [Eucalyptus grandis]|uniref:putative F-box protein At3g16210 n=1 Tax=Eucalyptus grandis TaxID=71139 RepID=UPI00192F0E5E|nr:putative F-box protein At3g16210 [Eucalyptus grandis]